MMPEKYLEVNHAQGLGVINDAALTIRKQVFIAEQGVPTTIEIDGLDNQTEHYVGFLADKPVTTARVAKDAVTQNWHIQRVATLRDARGNGYAATLLKQIITDARNAHAQTLDLGAQVPAIGFYEKLGFVAEGPVFQEANIDHRHMIFTVE
ncbi:GNAT family N-acetyltransferase [Weissella jogaejeotgali]|nr:GNAT family N-acetyltransferase [Weissella jogaejeotgali]